MDFRKKMSKHILIVEDEPTIAENIRYALTTDGFQTTACSTGKEALQVIQNEQIDLAILDVGLPDVLGFDLCKIIRQSKNVPVIFLTARNDELDKVVGLEIGADDYVTKPFSPRELSARVRAVLRRSSGFPITKSNIDFAIDQERYQIIFRGSPLPLSRYEFRLLAILIETPGRVYTRERLMGLAWEEPEMSLERTVDAHIKSIRAKLRDAGGDPDIIVTHRGIGYSFKES